MNGIIDIDIGIDIYLSNLVSQFWAIKNSTTYALGLDFNVTMFLS